MPTNFLWSTGAGGGGILTSTGLALLTTELNSIANSSWCISSVGGASGIFGSTLTGQGMWGYMQFLFPNPTGSSATGPAAGGNLAGWFLASLDSGVSFESSSVLPARSPDFIIPLSTSLIAPGAPVFQSYGPILIPPLPFKVLLANNIGNALGAGGTAAGKLNLVPVSMQF